MAIDPSAVWDFAKEVIGAARPDRGRTLATVTRIDADGTTWVTTGDGGEAPAASAAAGVSVGDTVTVEWDGAAMGIRGNVSNPSPAGSVVRRAVARAQGVADAAQRVADAVNQHFFADTSGIHVTEATQEEWETSHSGANVLINSVGQLFRDGLNNLLTLTTEGNARALTIWDGLGNTAAHVRAIIGAAIQLGNASESHALLDYHSMQLVDKNGNAYFHASDLRDATGYATITDTFRGDGSTRVFSLSVTPTTTDYTVTVSDGSGGAVTKSETKVTFATAPTSGATITVEYVTTSDDAKAYTLGTRRGSTVGAMSTVIGKGGYAPGAYAVAEGNFCTAGGGSSHAEGFGCVARGGGSHAEGQNTTASGGSSHAEGSDTTASGACGHAEGWDTTASGYFSHAQNRGTRAAYINQTAIGRYNDNNSGNALEIGNGTDDEHRSNAFAVDWAGNVECAGYVSAGKLMAAYAEDTCTIESGATEYNLNACWSNGACCTVSLSVNLTSALANGGTVRIATAPSGYVPPYSVIGSVYITGATASAMAIIGTGGGITLNNRSGSSISTSANVYVSFTFAPA